MKYFSVLLTKVIQYEVVLVADNEIVAEAKATCGPLEKVKDKEGVYSVEETDASQAGFNVSIHEIDRRLFNVKTHDPSEICHSCGEPLNSYDGCFYCT